MAKRARGRPAGGQPGTPDAGRLPWLGIAAGALAVIYVGLALWLPAGVFWHPDEGSKYLIIRALRWEGGGLAFDVPYAGRTLDPDLAFFASRCNPIYPRPTPDGGLATHWPIWFPLAERPFFEIAGYAGLWVIPIGCGLAVALLAGWLAARLGGTPGSLSALLIGLATPLPFYSLSLFEHTLAVLCAVAAVCLAVGSLPGAGVSTGAVLLLLAGAAALRIEMAGFALMLLLAWVVASRVAEPAGGPQSDTAHQSAAQTRVSLARLLAVFTIGGFLLAAALYSMPARYGHYFGLLAHVWGETRRKLPHVVSSAVDFFIHDYRPELPFGSPILDWAALAAVGAIALAAFVRSHRLEAALLLAGLLMLFQYGAFVALASAPYIGHQGVLAVATYLPLGFFALPEAWRRREYALLLLALTALGYPFVAFVMIFVLRVNLDGDFLVGLDGGVRYVLAGYPLGAVLSLVALQRFRQSARPPLVRSLVTVVWIAMVLVAVQYHLRGVQWLHDNRALIASWQAALPDDEPVVTDVWWLPAAMAPHYVEHPMFCVASRSEVSEWLPLAERGGAGAFTFASRQPIEPGTFGPAAVRLVAEPPQFVQGMYLQRFRLADR
jgi:hypothetical protein